MKEVTGSIGFMGVLEFLQVAMFNHRDLTMLLDNAAGRGAIVMSDGVVIHAQRDQTIGVGALFPLLQGASEGTFQLVELPKELPATSINLTTEQILMRVAMHLPESSRTKTSDPTWAFGGDTDILAADELLQIFENSKRPASVEFTSPDAATVSFVIADGSIVSAQGGGKEAPDAVFPLMGARGGTFQCTSLTTPPKADTVFDIASIIMEGLRQRDEAGMIRHELSAEDNPHAQETLARLEAGELDVSARLQLARRYMPGGESAPAFVVARLCVDVEPGVRQAALESLEELPDPILEVFAADTETPPPLLRYLLTHKKSATIAAAAILNENTPLAAIILYAPKAKSPLVFDAFRTRKELLEQSRELRTALKTNTKCPFIPQLDTLEKLAKPQLRKRKFTAIIVKPKYDEGETELVLEQPDVDPNVEKVEQKIGPRELGFIAKRGSLRQKKKIVCSNEDELAVEIVSQAGIPDAFIQDISENKMANAHALKHIGTQPKYKRNIPIAKALVFNPKTPVAASIPLINMLRIDMLSKAATSRDLPDALRQAARHLMDKKSKNK